MIKLARKSVKVDFVYVFYTIIISLCIHWIDVCVCVCVRFERARVALAMIVTEHEWAR